MNQDHRGGYKGNYRNENYGRVRGMSREGNIETIIEGLTEVAVVDLDQVQVQVSIQIESDAISVESMITFQKTV